VVKTGLLTTNAGGEIVLKRVRVRILSGDSANSELLLDCGTRTIGSSVDAELTVSDRSVSRFHAELGLLADGVRLRDLDSTNGSFVGGHRIESMVLRPPCEFVLGKVRVGLSPADLPAPDIVPEARSFGELVGESPAMRRAFALLETAALSEVSVLIEGESGTGKTAAARALHKRSTRRDGPFVVFDAIAPGPLEQAWQSARGGTLLVENIDSAARALAEGLEALTGLIDRGEDVRLIATARCDLRDAVQSGNFPRALYFRIAALRVHLPPLRERREDVPVLLEALANHFGVEGIAESIDASRFLQSPLEGNIRELLQVMQQAASTLPRTSQLPPAPPVQTDVSGLPFKAAKEQLLDAFEKQYIEGLLTRHEGNISRASVEADLDRNYLSRLAKKHGLR
jgi:DNA-binding NtrC family response regulator